MPILISVGLAGVNFESREAKMGKIWGVIRAQFNKLANYFWTMDPIAQMQFEYDKSVEQLKEGRKRVGTIQRAGGKGVTPGR